MKRRYLLTLAIALPIAALAFFIWRNPKPFKTETTAFYPLLERTGTAASWAEWATTKTSAEQLVRIVRDDPADKKSALALAGLYIQEGRASGNHDYYDGAALHYIEQVLKNEPAHFEALTMKALIQLSRHHFARALVTAQKAQAQNPHNAFVYGLMVDSYVELGQYEKAVESSDKMISIRPDMRSYSRVAYLREIHGDYRGAIGAMEMAVDAGGQGDEPSAWTRVQLGRLYEQTGQLPLAAAHYQAALDDRPLYAYALAGQSRIAAAGRDYSKALALLLQADTLVKDHGFKEEIAQLYLAMDNKPKAMAVLRQMEKDIRQEIEDNKGDPDAPYHTDAELAAVLLLMENYDQALPYALAEYNRRPANIEVNETVAWLYYKKGATGQALPHAEQALKTGCRNPTTLARMGLVFAQAGKRQQAKTLLQQALENNPNMEQPLRQEAAGVLKTL